MGDIHHIADSIVWFPAEDSGFVAYPFEILNDKEYAEVEKGGAMPYRREQHTRMNQMVMQRILLKTKRLTIIEAEKSNGSKVARHPLVLQLNERIDGGLKSIAQHKEIAEAYTFADRQVIGQNKNPQLVELGEEPKLKALELTGELRRKGLAVAMDTMGRNMKGQFKYADRLNAKYTIVIGEDELASGEATVKEMATGQQRKVGFEDLENMLYE
jgi:hypothetical protein